MTQSLDRAGFPDDEEEGEMLLDAVQDRTAAAVEPAVAAAPPALTSRARGVGWTEGGWPVQTRRNPHDFTSLPTLPPALFAAGGQAEEGPSRGAASDGRGAEFDECLADVVESSLIPRLIAASAAAATEPAGARGDPAELDRFCRVLLTEGLDGAMRIIDGLRGRGVGIADIYSGYVAGAARRLGVLWEEDAISFTEVSTGLSRLHGVVRRLSPGFVTGGSDGSGGRSALFAVTPGETHALGVVIAAEHFARAGWRLRVDLDPDMAGLVRAVGRDSFDVVGLSISASRYIDRLKRTVAMVRKANPASVVVVGGSLLAEQPELADDIRPDYVAADAESATRAMTSILDGAGRSTT
jgi:methanogenic corrinoid protein MtbC1